MAVIDAGSGRSSFSTNIGSCGFSTGGPAGSVAGTYSGRESMYPGGTIGFEAGSSARAVGWRSAHIALRVGLAGSIFGSDARLAVSVALRTLLKAASTIMLLVFRPGAGDATCASPAVTPLERKAFPDSTAGATAAPVIDNVELSRAAVDCGASPSPLRARIALTFSFSSRRQAGSSGEGVEDSSFGLRGN